MAIKWHFAKMFIWATKQNTNVCHVIFSNNPHGTGDIMDFALKSCFLRTDWLIACVKKSTSEAYRQCLLSKNQTFIVCLLCQALLPREITSQPAVIKSSQERVCPSHTAKWSVVTGYTEFFADIFFQFIRGAVMWCKLIRA